MSKKSTQIALGGVFSALCLVLMFMTGLIPFATYSIPAVAGAMLVAVVEENGRKTATLVYVTVSALSVFIVPDREAAMIFVVFFGYYPIIKGCLERIRPSAVCYLCKLLLFNVAVVWGYLMVIFVLGMPDLISDMGDLGKYGGYILLAMGNLVFVVYDFALTRYTHIYVHWFKPRFLRR